MICGEELLELVAKQELTLCRAETVASARSECPVIGAMKSEDEKQTVDRMIIHLLAVAAAVAVCPEQGSGLDLLGLR